MKQERYKRSELISEFFEKLGNILDENSSAKEFAASLQKIKNTGYFADVLRAFSNIDEVFSELNQIIKGLEGQKDFIFVYYSIEDLVLIYKNYYILWGTIQDLFASILNTIFDIGYDARDIKLPIILRNKHLRGSKIHSILNKYKFDLKFDSSNKNRNDVIHRNIVNDSEISDILSKRNSITSRHFSIFNESKLSEEEYKDKMKQLDKEIKDLFVLKKSFFSGHFDMLIEMIKSTMPVLADKFYERVKIKGKLFEEESSFV